MTLFNINPGKYRHVVTIQKQTTARNPYGEISEEWTDVAKARAGIFPISGKEVFQKQFVESEISHRIHIRYNPTYVINSQMRILFNNRVFSIVSPPINFQEKNVELQMLCKEDE